MLFDFDVFIRPEDLEKVKIKERLVEWGGELYSQEPPRYEYDKMLIFEEFLDKNYFMSYINKFINESFCPDKYKSFWLQGDCLSELERRINISNFNVEDSILYKFLIDLSELDDFAIFLIRDEEEIDTRYQIKTKEELIRIFCGCLNWESPEGALITKQSL